MAGEWIKMRVDLLTSPKVVRMASALQADRFRIAGGLLSVWCLFDAHSEDGHLSGYSKQTLDDLAAWPGFSAAMGSVGWLIDDGESLALPEFEAHNGASAKRRAQDANRKRAVRNMSASEADKKRTREEKRREELNTNTSADVEVPPPAKAKASRAKPAKDLDYSSWPSLPSDGVLSDWLELRKHLKAPVSQTVIDAFGREMRKAEPFGFSADDCLRYAVVKSWRGFQFDWMQKGIAEQSGGLPATRQGQAVATQGRAQQGTRVRTIAEDLNDRSWAE